MGAPHSPDCSQKNTFQSSVDTSLGTCAPLFEVQTLDISCLLALEKYLRYLSVKPSESPPSSLPGSAPERWNLFFRLDAARPLPSPSQVGLINGLSSRYNEVQRGVGLLGRSPNSFCWRITFGSLCTIKQRTWGSLIYQVGSEDNYFSSSQYSRRALTAEAKQGSWGIQTLFTFRCNWILELYTKLGKGVSDQDGEEDRLLYRVTDRLI